MQTNRILEKLPLGIILFSEDLRITYINSTGNSFLKLASDNDYLDLTGELEKLVCITLQNGLQQKRLIKIYAYGRSLTLKAKIELMNPSGMVMVILEDRTNTSKLEDTVLKAEKLAIMGQIATGILVEIKNPLTVVKGFCQLINTDEKVKREYIGLMGEELDKISKMIDDLSLNSNNARLSTYRDIAKDIEMWFHHRNRTSGLILVLDEILQTSISRKAMSAIIAKLLDYFSSLMEKSLHIIVIFKSCIDEPGLSFNVRGNTNAGSLNEFFDAQELKLIIKLIENNNGKLRLTVVNNTTIDARLSLPPIKACL